jgi:predicted ribosome quality control (RQC) complex YloA/Tae2 family protein
LLNNIHILKILVKNFQDLVGSKLVDAYTQFKGIATLEFFDGEEIKYLTFSTIPDLEGIFLKNNSNKKKSNRLPIFPKVMGEIVQDIELIDSNRIIKFQLINFTIYFLLYGKSQNNIIVINNSNQIIDAFRHPREIIDMGFDLSANSLKEISEFPLEYKILRAVANSNFLLGKHFAEEVLQQVGINPQSLLSALSQNNIEAISNASLELISKIEKSKKFYILSNNYLSEGIKQPEELIFSPILLNNFPQVIAQSEDINYFIIKTITLKRNKLRFNKLYKQLEQINLNYLKRSEKKVKDYYRIEEKRELAKKYQLLAELLYSAPNMKDKNLSQIELQDYEGNQIVISLNPKLTIIENINSYYLKSKKIAKDIEIAIKNYEKNEKEHNIHKNRYVELASIVNNNTANDYYDLEKHFKKYQEFYQSKMQQVEQNIAEKFRKIPLTDNAILYVGKDARNNDELTFGFGKANDLWFHLRGGSGSHCILKFTGKGDPPKEIIEKAAAIAAYYSSQRNAGYVPVIYTYRKFIRKPKGANPGAVVVAKEEVVMVQPRTYEL